MNRRQFTSRALAGTATALLSRTAFSRFDERSPLPDRHRDLLRPVSQTSNMTAFYSQSLGEGKLSVLRDGNLRLPVGFLRPSGISEAELDALLSRYGLDDDIYTPDCNITLWQHGDRTVLFDVGAGSQFMSSTGRLPMALQEAGIDADSVSDVVLTHAHPDHLWGLLDDFDDLSYVNANIHIHRAELDYWMAEDTLGKTPESRQSFVVGAQSRLRRAADQLFVFEWGQELIPGIEAVDTRGHTPGHTAFVLHQEEESVMIVGDALNNVALAFEYPSLASPADQDPQLAGKTRLALLDRLAADQMRLIAFHLPTPGLGRVERGSANSYRFIPQTG